jgi:FtsZ-binding cell division protein ZapB
MDSPPGMSSPGAFPAVSNGTPSRQEALQVVRDAVLADVDAKVAEKVGELWRRGQQAIKNLEEKHKEKESKLAQEISRMSERQRQLEAENDQLKQHITTLAGRFQLLGAVFGGSAAAGGTSYGGGTPVAGPPGIDAPYTPLPSATESPLRPASTLSGCSGGGISATTDDRDGDSKDFQLPSVPPFPTAQNVCQPIVSAQLVAAAAAAAAATCGGGTAPTTPLSLVEALNTNAQAQAQAAAQRKPLSLASSLMPASPVPEGAVPRTTFSFTIRKADDADLGLNVSHDKAENVLRVEDIRPAGAVESWNRACSTGNTKDKAVLPGDRIVRVNDVQFDPAKMLEECKDKKTLKLTIVRGGDGPLNGDTATQDGAADAPAAAAATVLRADASVFVPGGSFDAADVTVPPESAGEAQDTDAAGVAQAQGQG